MKICVLPGDGIGPEVTEEAVKILAALGDFTFVYGDIGYDAYQQIGSSLPDETLQKIADADATLFGAVTTPPNIPNYESPILKLRQHFDLYVNLRPCKTLPIEISHEGIDMDIVRENTEGLYSRRERVEDNGDTAITERVITRKGSERIIRYAFELAKNNGRKTVTIVHKANVLRATCGLFREVALEVANDYPNIEMNEQIVDACAMQLIKNPGQFEVIVTTNLFGDILSDAASMLVGGLGVAYSGNIGEHAAVFEPVHGSAPKYVGTHNANPLATILAARLMLEHIGMDAEAKQLQTAIEQVLQDGNVTPDLGGSCTTQQVTEHILEALQ
ncbi:MAG: isocitrate/isopropylmalate dehydrogenase family protein [Candidatus Woesearchaeota archaeon]|nr:isocitrate/isopropylmalate dehydrogenase family protein [Candidatus Woesearchaeota archaeon]